MTKHQLRLRYREFLVRAPVQHKQRIHKMSYLILKASAFVRIQNLRVLSGSSCSTKHFRTWDRDGQYLLSVNIGLQKLAQNIISDSHFLSKHLWDEQTEVNLRDRPTLRKCKSLNQSWLFHRRGLCFYGSVPVWSPILGGGIFPKSLLGLFDGWLFSEQLSIRKLFKM